VSPNTGEPLLAYHSISDHGSTTLLVEMDGQQFSVYYMSHVLAGVEQ